MTKLNLLSKNFAKELEKELKKDIEQEAKKHPARFLDDHIGKSIQEKCAKCDLPEMKIISGGKARCANCGHTVKVSVDLNWR